MSVALVLSNAQTAISTAEAAANDAAQKAATAAGEGDLKEMITQGNSASLAWAKVSAATKLNGQAVEALSSTASQVTGR